ncbi:hypothetical protein CLV35_0232 [Motilibacter peucedani]|uniref:Helix-turn-helix protein n=1 Tax=Motilibacter peucedani TaxID=598650 RepID=A0A420XUW4_9ACTN|nr:hypothetical protein [Motilibacter peucedani]RKS80643.1 hypothetical protein CLV35_0232 [Motilibacter peucedani]
MPAAAPTGGTPAYREARRRARHRSAQRTALAQVGPAAALPRGSVRAKGQAAWVAAVAAHPDTALLRADAHTNLRSIAATLARYADWNELTSRPTWARLAALAGVSERTVARWTAWLRQRGLLGVVETGSTPATRPMALRDVEGNRAALYLLCHPVSLGSAARHPQASDPRLSEPTLVAPVDESGMPSGPAPQEMRQNGRAGAVLSQAPLRGVAMTTRPTNPAEPPAGSEDPVSTPGATQEAKSARTTAWGRHTPARTRRDMLALVDRLQAEGPVYRAVGSPRRLRHLLRPWLNAGWTIAGLEWAIDHKPDGEPWRYAWRSVDELRNPAGWLRHRLRRWTTEDGAPLPDPRATPPAPQPVPQRPASSSAGPNAEARVLLAAARAKAAAATRTRRPRTYDLLPTLP